MKPTWTATYGIVTVLTDNDCGYDWDRKDEKHQLAWERPKETYDKREYGRGERHK